MASRYSDQFAEGYYFAIHLLDGGLKENGEPNENILNGLADDVKIAVHNALAKKPDNMEWKDYIAQLKKLALPKHFQNNFQSNSIPISKIPKTGPSISIDQSKRPPIMEREPVRIEREPVRIAKINNISCYKGDCGGFQKAKGHLDTQMFPECEGTKFDRNIVKKTVERRKKHRKHKKSASENVYVLALANNEKIDKIDKEAKSLISDLFRTKNTDKEAIKDLVSRLDIALNLIRTQFSDREGSIIIASVQGAEKRIKEARDILSYHIVTLEQVQRET